MYVIDENDDKLVVGRSLGFLSALFFRVCSHCFRQTKGKREVTEKEREREREKKRERENRSSQLSKNFRWRQVTFLFSESFSSAISRLRRGDLLRAARIATPCVREFVLHRWLYVVYVRCVSKLSAVKFFREVLTIFSESRFREIEPRRLI